MNKRGQIKIIVICVAIIFLLVGGSLGYFYFYNNNSNPITPCSSYCIQKGYSAGSCFDCVYLEGIALPAQCNSSNFFSDDNTVNLCTKSRLKDNTIHGCFCQYSQQEATMCSKNSDCKLIYSHCDCEAVSINDLRTALESERICKMNECSERNVSVSCVSGVCVRSDKI